MDPVLAPGILDGNRDDGMTVIDENAKKMQVATDWKSLDGYCEFLVKRLTS